MNANDMTNNALMTWHKHNVPRSFQISHAALGLAGETGELVDLIKKHLYKPGRTASAAQISDELGDVMYYVIILAWLWDIDLDRMIDNLFVKLADGHGWNGSSEKIGDALP